MADQEETSDLSDVEEQSFTREVPITYYGAEDIVGIFADQAMVSHSTGLFTLLFFQMQIPPTSDVEELRKLEQIPARCVSKVILTPQLMEQLFGVLEANLKKYKLRIAEARETIKD